MKTTQTGESTAVGLNVPQNGSTGGSGGIVVRWGVVIETKLMGDDEEQAKKVIEILGASDLKALMFADVSNVVKFQVSGSEVLGFSQLVDVSAKAHTTINKVVMKKATKLNPPAKVKPNEIERLLKWLSIEENIVWADGFNHAWIQRLRDWFSDNGHLTDSQLKALRKTKRLIQTATRTTGRAFYEKRYDEYLKDGKKEQAQQLYEKHLKIYVKI